jgi:hypothetical protein
MVIEAAMTAAKEKREFFMMLPRLSWAGSWSAKFATRELTLRRRDEYSSATL